MKNTQQRVVLLLTLFFVMGTTVVPAVAISPLAALEPEYPWTVWCVRRVGCLLAVITVLEVAGLIKKDNATKDDKETKSIARSKEDNLRLLCTLLILDKMDRCWG